MEKYFHFDRNKTLQELDGEEWGEPNFDSHLVIACHELRKKPLSSFSIEDLRIMIGQNIGLEYLVPLALENLDDNIFAEGVYYCGDLIDVVLKVSKEFWESNPTYKNDIEHLIDKNIRTLDSKLSSFRQRFL